MPRVVVIGASRGIGRELVAQYAADGWEVLATVRSDAAASELSAISGVTARVADITDEASLAALAASETAPIDLLVINAGMNIVDTDLASLDAQNWTRTMTTNALGPLLVARTLGKSVREGGSIVALSSVMGSIGANSGGGYYAYRMSKAALNMGLMNLSHELKARRIAIAALHPGWVKTDMGGSGATVEIPDSVKGLRKVIAKLEPGKTARYLNYLDTPLGW